MPGASGGDRIQGTAFARNVEEFGATADDPARAVVIGRLKLLERGGSYELYDLADDPRELADRGPEQAALVAELAARLPVDQGQNGGPRDETGRRRCSIGTMRRSCARSDTSARSLAC